MDNYKTKRAVDYRSTAAPLKKKVRRRAEPRSCMKPLDPLLKPGRVWIDCPQDRAEVAAVLKGGSK